MEDKSFWDHLDDLRACLIRALVIFVVFLIGSFIALQYIFDPVILGPSKGDFFIYKALGFIYGSAQDVDIININVASQFMTHMTTSLWMGLLLSFPFLMYQLWIFIRPALYKNEIKGVRTAFCSGTVLFYIGCAVGYLLVFPITFRFLTQYSISQEIVNHISLNSYMSILITMVFVMGLVFELPSLSWMLGKIGILNKQMLKEWRRYAVAILLVLAAIITPTGDPFTLMVVFVPLYLLYELSILVVKK